MPKFRMRRRIYSAPVCTATPSISGTLQEGFTGTCSTGTWSGSPSYAYQWNRDGVAIGGATANTRVFSSADTDHLLSCTVTATNAQGLSASATTASAAIAAPPDGAFTFNMGTKTYKGYGGYPVGVGRTIASGTGMADFTVNALGEIVPVGTYGSAVAVFTRSSYDLTLDNGQTVAITITSGVAHAATNSTNDTSSNFQLRTYLNSATAIAKGETIKCRSGHSNPTGAVWRIRPPSGGYTTGSGRITVESEEPLGFKVGALFFDSAVSGAAAVYPIDLVDIHFYNDTPTYSGSLCSYSSAGGGVGYYSCRFECGPSVTAPWGVDGVKTRGTCTVDDCDFYNVSQAIALGSYALDCIITNNTAEGIYGDFCSGSFENITFEDNFAFNKRYSSGFHGDYLQHLGWTSSTLAGTANGSQTVFSATVPLSAATLLDFSGVKLLVGSSNTYPTAESIDMGAGTATGTVNSITYTATFNVSTGEVTVTFASAPANGVKVYFMAPTSNKLDMPVGSIKRNFAVRNIGLDGQGDYQFLFFDDTYGRVRLTAIDMTHNIGHITFANAIYLLRSKNANVAFNTVLNDFQANSGITASATINMANGYGGTADGTGGTVTRNVANALSFASQSPAPTQSPNPNVTLSKSLGVYQAAFPAYANTGLTTRAAVITAFTPDATWYAANGNSGALDAAGVWAT
jgi:hypothetical protein